MPELGGIISLLYGFACWFWLMLFDSERMGVDSVDFESLLQQSFMSSANGLRIRPWLYEGQKQIHNHIKTQQTHAMNTYKICLIVSLEASAAVQFLRVVPFSDRTCNWKF